MTWSVHSPDGTLALHAGLDDAGRLGYCVLLTVTLAPRGAFCATGNVA